MNKIRNFLNSDLLIIITYLVTIICWFYQKQIVSILFYLIIAIFIYIFNGNRITIATLIMAGIINYRENTLTGSLWLFIGAFLVMVPFIIYDFYKNKVGFNDKIFISMFFIFLTSILSLINTNHNTINDAIIGVLQIGAYALIYLYFLNNQQKKDYLYIAKNALFLSLAIAFEFLIYIINYEGDSLGKNIDLGWGISNQIAIVEIMLIPLILFLYSKDQYNVFVLLSIIISITIVILTLSKGAYLTLLLMLSPLLIVSYFHMQDKKKYIDDIIYSFFILALLIYIISNIYFLKIGIIEYFMRMSERGWFNDQSRIQIYKIGYRTFLNYPFFGAGAYTGGYYLGMYGFKVTTYHNYFIQVIATTGLFGLIAFITYLINIFKKVLSMKHFYNICILFVVVGLLIHGLVDNTWFNPIIMVIISIYLSTIITEKKLIIQR